MGDSYQKHFINKFEELGGNVLVYESVNLGETDFKSTLTKIKRSNPDVILAIHISNELGLILKEIKELGIESKIISYYQAENPVVIDVAKNAAEGLIVSSPESGEKTNTQINFEKEYYVRFNSFPTVLTTNAYDALNIQVNAYKECNGERECIKEYMYSLKDYDGVSGVINIGSDGTAIKEIIFKIVKDGKFIYYE